VDRQITIELCRHNLGGNATVVSYETLELKEAKARLETKCVNGHFYRVTPPDVTGNVAGDESRFAADCKALGIPNPYAS
jgi:hypothetical protein